MKKSIQWIAVLMIAACLLGGCKKEGYAIKVGSQVVSEGTFARQAATLSEYIAEMDGGDLEDPEVFEESVCDYLIELKLFAEKFDQLGLEFSAKDEEAINDYLSEVIGGWNSITEFQTALSQSGYTYEEYLEELYDYKKKEKVLEYYYGLEGLEPVAVQDLKDYYAHHHAVIKYVAVATVDEETGAKLSEKEVKKAKKKAEDAYAEATRPQSEDHFAEIIEIYSDDTTTKDTPMVISDEEIGSDSLSQKVMQMEVGQVILVELDEGYMVVKRYDATAEEHFTAEIQQSTLEDYRAEEIEALLAKWREEISIKINKKAIKKYRNEK